MSTALANTVVVLDFETTGLSPGQGDRAIEIGAVRIENGHISERFSALMNPGFNVSSFIEQYTGISNAMLKQAPPCGEVMADFVEFIGDDNLVAHNASFDKRFLDAEIERLSAHYPGQFACSLLLSRRLFALLKELECRHGIFNPDFELLLTLGKKSKHAVQSFLQGYATKK